MTAVFRQRSSANRQRPNGRTAAGRPGLTVGEEVLVPELRELPGFSGYYLIEAENGVMSSLGLFETSEQADRSKGVVTKWINDENFDAVIPNPPKITSGKVVAHSNGIPALV